MVLLKLKQEVVQTDTHCISIIQKWLICGICWWTMPCTISKLIAIGGVEGTVGRLPDDANPSHGTSNQLL